MLFISMSSSLIGGIKPLNLLSALCIGVLYDMHAKLPSLPLMESSVGRTAVLMLLIIAFHGNVSFSFHITVTYLSRTSLFCQYMRKYIYDDSTKHNFVDES